MKSGVYDAATDTHALQAPDADDLQGRLRLAGFTLEPCVGDEDPEIRLPGREAMTPLVLQPAPGQGGFVLLPAAQAAPAARR